MPSGKRTWSNGKGAQAAIEQQQKEEAEARRIREQASKAQGKSG